MTSAPARNDVALTLRPYQVAAVQAALGAIDSDHHSGLWAMPTGCGKTVAFVALAGRLRRRTLVLVHRDELIRQAEAKFRQMFPAAPIGIVQAERDEWDFNEDGLAPSVAIASVPSLHARRLTRIPRDRFGLVVVDEAHHAAAPSWQAILNYFRPGFILGVTATPERADGKGLRDRFGPRPLYSYPLRQAINDGWLARIRQYAVETSTCLDGVSRRCGDYAEGELGHAVNTPSRNRTIVEAYQKRGEGRRAVVFAVNVQHVQDLTAAFQEAGIKAAGVIGSMPRDERRELLKAFDAGRVPVLVNCEILTEGYDSPGIEVILMARPTQSRTFYIQAVGRGLRLAPGKKNLLVLDFVDNSRRHKLVTIMDLMGAVKEQDAGGRDVIEVADEDRQEAERAALIPSQRPLKWRLKMVCPWPDIPALDGFVPTMTWQLRSATKKQIRFLRGFGIEITRDLLRGEASHLINRALEYEAAFPTPATPAQKWRLMKEGVWNEDIGRRDARRIIAEIMVGRSAGSTRIINSSAHGM